MKLSDITNKKKFTQGKRGIIYTGTYKRMKVAIKQQRKDIGATGTVVNEGNQLKRLNKKGIGPKLLFVGEDYIVYKFVEGEFLPKWLPKKKVLVKKVLKEIFDQCFTMDKMKVNKEEMTHPYKHIIVTKKGVVQLDFERCKSTLKPKNVTQFSQYLLTLKMVNLLFPIGFKYSTTEIRELTKTYKHNETKKNYEKILKAFFSK